MNVVNFSEFKKNLKFTLDRVNDNEEIFMISRNKKKNVVLISLNEYNSLKETMYLLSSEKNCERLQESIHEMNREK